MGRRISRAYRNMLDYAKSDKKTMRKLALSLLSLLTATVILISMTFSWFTISTAKLETGMFKLDCGKGLRVNDSGTNQLSFKTEDQNLVPASSVDGRNLYFPTDGSDFSDVTSQMTFRSANVGDKNVNYIQIDFTLTAQQNHTALYINEDKTSIRVANKLQKGQTRSENDWSVAQAAALRSALWSSTAENGVPNTPIVFNPTKSTVRTAAVEDVDRSTGAFISAGRQVAHAFSDYSFGGSPVATLSKGVVTKFSYLIWLEGTDPKCTNQIRNKEIEIKLAFTTSWDKTQTIRFKDSSSNGWVKKKLEAGWSLSLHFDEVRFNETTQQYETTGNSTDFNMYKYSPDSNQVTDTWSCNIPGDMRRNITFVLRPPSGTQDTTYIFSRKTNNSTEDTYDRGTGREYEITAAAADNASQCQGHWIAIGDSDGAGHDSGNLDGDDF